MSQPFVVIMAGGIGSRFWPKSRIQKPKQFLDILGTGKTLLQMTFQRFLTITSPERIFIVTHEPYRKLVIEQLPELKVENILSEPMRRNTAPCLAYAAFVLASIDPQATMVVAPSDHLIVDSQQFETVIHQGLTFTQQYPALLTLGIVPTRPDTGYGYIQFHEESAQKGVYQVKTFTEKPNLDLATQFIQSGDFLWNSGIFIWQVNTILDAIHTHLPEIYETFAEGQAAIRTSEEAAFIQRAYSQCPNISIDYGIMEKADQVFVIPSSFGWSDLGTWQSVYHHYDKDAQGNALGAKHVIATHTQNCIVVAPENKLVVLEGLEGYCIVDTPDALLICRMEQEEGLRQIHADIRRAKGEEFL